MKKTAYLSDTLKNTAQMLSDRLPILTTICAATALCLTSCDHTSSRTEWSIAGQEDWEQATHTHEGLVIEHGMAKAQENRAVFSSTLKRFPQKKQAESLVVSQSDAWLNWEPVENLGPVRIRNAPIFLSIEPGNYWVFGQFGIQPERRAAMTLQGVDLESRYQPEDTALEGFDLPLKTTRFPHEFDAPGGLKPSQGGYHAWQSRDMVNWVHHGAVTTKKSRWATTAEYVDGAVYIYYDFPNDQDPHLFIDEDLTDGVPGKDLGMVFKDPSHGSDCGIIRGRDGRFHLIYEDYSPINAQIHSWDSPLAGHAVSPDGKGDFKILDPAVDERTNPTGRIGTYTHPYWAKDDPENYPTNVAEYEIHEPEQNAYGDWAAIAIGGQYYLFGDYHPAGDQIRVGWFTSPSIDQPFEFVGEIGRGHPDPDIGFAEGKFYLITQMETDYVSPGPWVGGVEARVGVDRDDDGRVDAWTAWTEITETYAPIPGFAKQIERVPARLDLSSLPSGYGFQYELRITKTMTSGVLPEFEDVVLSFL